MTRSAGRVLALAIVLVSVPVIAQQSRSDPPVSGRQPGTSTVSGHVTLGDDASTPVRRAVVTLTARDGSETLAAITDDNGEFTVTRVSAGRYVVKATKPAHPAMAYGARRPGGRGTLLVVNRGEHVEDLALVLPRGAVLAGRVTLLDGRPVPEVPVMAIPSWRALSSGSTAAAREVRTDDRGEFRLFGLAPDTYLVVALPSFGRGPVEHRTDGAVSDVLRTLRESGAAALTSADSAVTVTYAPTYFPGTPSISDAVPVTVAAGAVRDDLAFTIAAVPAATIRGQVVGLDGRPMSAASVGLEGVGLALPGAGAVAQVTHPGPSGRFQFTGVSPGSYRVRARAGGVTLTAGGTRTSISPSAQTQFAVDEVSVFGADIDGLVLRLQEGRRFSGAVIADDSATPPVWSGSSVLVEPITATPLNNSVGATMRGVPSREGAVDEMGHFTVTGLEPASYRIRVLLPPALAASGWRVESIRHGNDDLRDAPLTFDAGSLDGVSVHVTTRVTRLSGRFTTEAGVPAADFVVVAFPSDRTLWHPTSPRILMMRPALDGVFGTEDLPAGTYRLAALTDVADRELLQADFLESIYDSSIEIAIAEGQTTRQDIRIGRLPRR